MADIADRANDRVEVSDRLSVLEVQRRPAREVEATGECLSCGEAVAGELRWCDADCRDAWQRQQRRKR